MWAIGMFLIGKTLIPIYSAPMNLYINFTNQKEWRRYFIESKVQSFDLIYSYFFVTSNFCHSQSGSNLFFSYPYGIGHDFIVCLFVCLFLVCFFICLLSQTKNSEIFFFLFVKITWFWMCPLFITLSFLPPLFYPKCLCTPIFLIPPQVKMLLK